MVWTKVGAETHTRVPCAYTYALHVAVVFSPKILLLCAHLNNETFQS